VQRPPTTAALVCAAALILTGCLPEKKDTEPPTAPSGVSVYAGGATSVHVMWKAAEDNKAVTGYEIYQKDTKVKSVPATASMADVVELTPKTAYSFTVRARDKAGNLSAPSAAAAVTTPALAPEDKRPPTRPTGLKGSVGDGGSVTLTWAEAGDNTGVTAYDIYQEDTRIHTVSGAETSTEVPGLRPGTIYSFTVRARDAAENSSPDSNTVDLTTPSAPGAGVSTAPTELDVKVRDGSIELSWLPPEAEGQIKSHELYLNGKLATTIVWGAEPPEGRATYTMMITEAPGTRYSVKLRAKLPDGKWGDFSAQRTVVVR
jgi:chitodextrinase